MTATDSRSVLYQQSNRLERRQSEESFPARLVVSRRRLVRVRSSHFHPVAPQIREVGSHSRRVVRPFLRPDARPPPRIEQAQAFVSLPWLAADVSTQSDTVARAVPERTLARRSRRWCPLAPAVFWTLQVERLRYLRGDAPRRPFPENAARLASLFFFVHAHQLAHAQR